MTATNHVVTGALIGSLTGHYWLALPIAFGMHFVLDSLPHINYPAESATDKEFFVCLAVDAGIAGSILFSLILLQPHNWLLLVASGIVCASPDLMWLKYQIIDKLRGNTKPWPRLARFHDRIQKHVGWSPVYIASELVWLSLTGFWLASRLAT